MKPSDFTYEYPAELVAQEPLAERDASKMLIARRRDGSCTHGGVRDLPEYLKTGDVLVVNDSRVLPLRLFGKIGKRPIEILLLEQYQNKPERWRCLTKKASRMRAGEKIFFGLSAQAVTVGADAGQLLIEFAPGHRERAMDRHGAPPLPPYIRRDVLESYSAQDRERYQTVYANAPGSAAAPTAGLHLSEKLLQRIRDKGVEVHAVTLHVGLDTFQPPRVDDVSDHRMHGERYEISTSTAAAVNAAKAEGRRVIAVGTTATRALESGWRNGTLHAGSDTTHLFITPGYHFNVVDALLTNFHQPKSTLLMLVSAFAGRENILNWYAQAIAARYRLFSFGDCMLIL